MRRMIERVLDGSLKLIVCAAMALSILIAGATAGPARAASCFSMTLYILDYGYADPLTDYTNPAPNGCWHYARVVQDKDSSSFSGLLYEGCKYYPPKIYNPNSPRRWYDDTGFGHSDVSAVNNCIQDPPPTSTVDLEYMSPLDPCPSFGPCWSEVQGSATIEGYYAELYHTNADPTDSNQWNDWTLGIGPVNWLTSAGTVNLSPYLTKGSGVYEDWTAERNKVLSLCQASGLNIMSVYSSIGIGKTPAHPDGAAEQQVITAMNTCDGG